MGHTPREIDDMGLWEFMCIRDGYRIANTVPDKDAAPKAPSYEQLLSAKEKYG